MTWTPHRITFRLLSPLHIGWRKTGNVQHTRSYATGRAFWGALSARLTRNGDGNNYAALGAAVADADYAEFLHGSGYRNPAGTQETKGLKPFVFARPYVPNMVIRGAQLWCHGGIVQWQIGSPIAAFLATLEQGLRAHGGLAVGATRRELTRLETIAPPSFTSPMRFTALSPLMVDCTPVGEQNKHFVRATDERFAALIAANLREKYRTLFGTEPSDTPFHFAFDPAYAEARGGIERCSKLAHYKGLHIKRYLAPFVVRGELDLIQLGWASGFGNGNSQGFGMAG